MFMAKFSVYSILFFIISNLHVFAQFLAEMGSQQVLEFILDGYSLAWVIYEYRQLHETDPEYYT